MITSMKDLLRVAFTSNATAQQPPVNSATSYATTAQQGQENSLSLIDLARNKLRNKHATTSQKDAQQAPLKKGVEVAQVERLCAVNKEKKLRHLVKLVSDYHNFSKEDYEEALETALADPVCALTCFTALARRAKLL